MAVPINLCPPADCSGGKTFPQSLCRKVLAVHKPGENEDGSYEPGLSFDDYCRMQTVGTRSAQELRLPVPDWAVNDSDLRKVILSYMSHRAFAGCQRVLLRGMTEHQKALFICAWMQKSVVRKIKILEKLSNEYMEHFQCTAPWCIRRRKTLRTMISGIDRQICMLRTPDVFARVVKSYYRQRLTSVEVGAECGLSPSGVRQLLRRISMHAQSLGYPAPPEQLRWIRAKERRRKNAALRAAEK